MLITRVSFLQLVLACILLQAFFTESLGYRIRTDKKAMRNSLVRFGKRSSAESPLENLNEQLSYDNVGGANVDGPQLVMYPMFGNRRFHLNYY
ncbi:hypothetical protein M3Y98_00401800 [Aphelenchoides besseyi]|nr:hypothetical protein M3Y98_00401800 [Aphelenchoides besseyi]KAI6202253.1 hypothetical protein M3Y96_00928700 [Aphelenchoides besseyi]KAI6215977.1 hypothetical protein M3Y94_00448600 [Aphelenchoides besseyi]